MVVQALRAQATALHAQGDALEKLADALDAAPSPGADTPLPKYVSRKSARELMALETRAFNAAGREIGFRKPGRELLLPTAALLEWIEGRRVQATLAAPPADENAAIPIEACRFLRRSRASRKSA